MTGPGFREEDRYEDARIADRLEYLDRMERRGAERAKASLKGEPVYEEEGE